MVLPLLVALVIASWSRITAYLKQLDGADSIECNGGKEDCISRLPGEIKEDCISGLPDDILSSILSRLSFRDATKTSILSRRWRYLHASMPNLDFNSLTMFGLPEGVHVCRQFLQKFVSGVNQFVELYSGPKINSFRFSFCFEREFAADTERWIRFAIRMGVEELDINFECNQKEFIFSRRYNFSKLPTLSYELLSASSNLKHLQLHACVVPSFNVKINSLKSLDLDGVPLAGREVEDILSCCLNLEQLRIRKCILPAKLCICGPSLRLKLLTINYCSGLEAIDLCAINLTMFECFDGKLINFSFSRVPKLERVFLYVFQKIGMPYIFNELPMYLPQLKTLLVRTASMQVAYIPARITLFSSLKQLDLFLSLGTRVELLKIACILSACPLLQKFCLMRKAWSCKNKNADIATEEAPPCHHMQLEEVELGGFVGTQNELTFALYFLRSAAVLKRMVISMNCTDYWGFGKYEHYKNNDAWSDKERKIIYQHLQGNALSGSAEAEELDLSFSREQRICTAKNWYWEAPWSNGS